MIKLSRHTLINLWLYPPLLMLPVALVALAMVCMKFKPDGVGNDELQLAPEIYEDSHMFYR